MLKKVIAPIVLVFLAAACVTNPVTEQNFNARKSPPALAVLFTFALPGVPQLIHGEYLEAAAYLGLTIGGLAGAIYSSGSNEILFNVSITAAMTAMTTSMADAVATTLIRHKQHNNLQKDLEEAGAFLKAKSVRIDPLFSALYKRYSEYPVGKIVLENRSSWDITDLKFSFEVKGYTDFAWESEIEAPLAAHESVERDLYILLNNKVLSITEDTPLTGRLNIHYRVNEKQLSVDQPVTFTLFNRNAMTWDDDRKLASFITPNDVPVRLFARSVAQMLSSSKVDNLDITVQRALQLFIALGVHGCVYVIDPDTPFIEFRDQKTAVDYIQFPRDTLYYKTGDCDDLVALYTSLLESYGVATAFITGPGHIFVAFDTGIETDEYQRVTRDKTQIFFMEGTVWVPVEATLVGSSFVEAWYSAARQYREWEQEGVLTVYRTREVWSEYEPVTLADPGWDVVIPDREEMERILARDIEALVGE